MLKSGFGGKGIKREEREGTKGLKVSGYQVEGKPPEGGTTYVGSGAAEQILKAEG